MIRTVIKILKKHLDEGREEFNQINDMLSLTSNYDVLDFYPGYNELRLLARELITTIKGIDSSDLITVPSIEEMTICVKCNICANPNDPYFEETVSLLAEGIIKWLRDERPFREGLDPFRKREETPWAFDTEEFQHYLASEAPPREQGQLTFAFVNNMVEFYLEEMTK